MCIFVCFLVLRRGEERTLWSNLSNKPLTGSHPVCILYVFVYLYVYLYFVCFFVFSEEEMSLVSNLSNGMLPRSHTVCICIFNMYLCLYFHHIFRGGEEFGIESVKSAAPRFSHPVQRPCCPLLVSTNQNLWYSIGIDLYLYFVVCVFVCYMFVCIFWGGQDIGIESVKTTVPTLSNVPVVLS